IDCESGIIFDNDEDRTDSAALLDLLIILTYVAFAWAMLSDASSSPAAG
ncbi:hypothetical protein O5254_27310, partial [Escherichia coli]|nr:hypothetical protein [Escherichia coli]